MEVKTETKYSIFVKSRVIELKKEHPELKKNELMKMASSAWNETPEVKNRRLFDNSINAIEDLMEEEKKYCNNEIYEQYSNFEEWKKLFTTYTYYHLCVLINRGNISDDFLQEIYDNDYSEYTREFCLEI